MTKSQLIKGAFRMLTLKLGQAKIPLIVTNHTYDVIGSYVLQKKWEEADLSMRLLRSFISARKEKDGQVIGNLIKAKTSKSRLSKENKDVTVH